MAAERIEEKKLINIVVVTSHDSDLQWLESNCHDTKQVNHVQDLLPQNLHPTYPVYAYIPDHMLAAGAATPFESPPSQIDQTVFQPTQTESWLHTVLAQHNGDVHARKKKTSVEQ